MKTNTNAEVKKQQLGDYVVSIDEALADGFNERVYQTGFSFLDEALEFDGTGGFREGDLIIISGKSGQGKTLLAQNIILNFLRKEVASLLFSYEVIINNVYKTFLKMGTGKQPLIYTPKKNVTGDINWIKEKIKESDEKGYMTKLVVIDHLDFVTAKNIKTSDVRRNEIANIVTELKNFAVEEKKIIILLAHVVKTREKTLQSEDIADSRAIANLADIILFIGRKADADGNCVTNNGAIRLAKNRLTGKHMFCTFFVDENGIIHENHE